MPSNRFIELEGRIRELRRLLLPAKFDPTGSYKDPLRVTTRALSFRVLAHAEVETYLEDRVLEIATACQQAWRQSGFVSTVTLHLLGFGGSEMARPPDTLTTADANKLKDWHTKVEIHDRLSRCVSGFYQRISRENHGVKEKNILDMFIPIGFDLSKLDPVLIQKLSNFGEARGSVAHTSGKAHLKKAVDPRDEYKILIDIVFGLSAVDLELDSLLIKSKSPTAQVTP